MPIAQTADMAVPLLIVGLLLLILLVMLVFMLLLVGPWMSTKAGTTSHTKLRGWS